MTGNGQSIQAFEKTKGKGAQGKGFPLLLGSAGFGCTALAVFTAVAPPSMGAAVQVSEALDKAGLDKGPLFLFGVALFALASSMRRGDRALAAAGASEEASLVGQQILGDMGNQASYLANLHAEVNAARAEIAEARREIKEASEKSADEANDEAGDPMFRMAASLDQLGARIGKRLDGSRDEMIEAVNAMRSFVEEVSERSRAEREAFAHEQRKLVESMNQAQAAAMRAEQESIEGQISQLREDMTSLVGQLANAPRVAVEAPPEVPEDEPAAQETGQERQEFCELQKQRQTSPLPALPLELAGDAPVLAMTPIEAAPAALPVAAEQEAEVALEQEAPAVQDEVAPSLEPEPEPAPEAPVAPLPMISLGAATPPLPFGSDLNSGSAVSVEDEAPVPPAPLPAPGEGLELIDDMHADRARAADLTPPLFPEIDPGSLGA